METVYVQKVPSFDNRLSSNEFPVESGVITKASVGEPERSGDDPDAIGTRKGERSESTPGAFPEEFKAYCYNPETANSDTCGAIIVAPQSSISRLIVIGNAELQKEFASRLDALTFSLHHLYPNPSRSIVNIRYTEPLGALEYITITIHNILGRKIREIKADRLLKDSLHTIIWNGRDEHGNQVRSGIYIVRLMVEGRLLKKNRYFEKRVTILK